MRDDFLTGSTTMRVSFGLWQEALTLGKAPLRASMAPSYPHPWKA